MRSFTIYTANVTGSSTNCLYPHAMIRWFNSECEEVPAYA